MGEGCKNNLIAIPCTEYIEKQLEQQEKIRQIEIAYLKEIQDLKLIPLQEAYAKSELTLLDTRDTLNKQLEQTYQTIKASNQSIADIDEKLSIKINSVVFNEIKVAVTIISILMSLFLAHLMGKI